MDSRFPELELDAQLCFPLSTAVRAVNRAYTPLLAEVGLTFPQYLSMLALWSSDGTLSVGQLGSRLRLDSGTLTPVLKRLESTGYLQRNRDPSDERRVLVSVTNSGKDLRDEVRNIPVRVAEAMSLMPAEAATLRDLLYKVMDHLDAAEPSRPQQ
jgi:DNA-binding MarR family transcriptional regulator